MNCGLSAIAQIKCINGELDGCLEYPEKIFAIESFNGTALALMVFVKLLKSARLKKSISAMSYLNGLIKLIEKRKPGLKASDPVLNIENVEHNLVIIQAYNILKQKIRNGLENSSFEGLQKTYESLVSLLTKAPDVEESTFFDGYKELCLIRCFFYLSELYEHNGKSNLAREARKEVMRIDPLSNFGEMVFIKQ